MDEIRNAIYLWIKEDAPVSVKMSLTVDKIDMLMTRMEKAVNKIRIDSYEEGHRDGYDYARADND